MRLNNLETDKETAATGAIKPSSVVASRVVALDGRVLRDEGREIAVETPVQVTYGNVPFAVMMLTPSDLHDFAYGFSLTEGVIETLEDIQDVVIGQVDEGVTVSIRLAGDKLHRHLARQRAMTGRTGCGVCGIEDLAALRRAKSVPEGVYRVKAEAIARALRELDARQPLNIATRAVHGAAWADLSGEIRTLREDVGRHNALDKLIGALLRQRVDPSAGFAVITSRCSFEMAEKAAIFGARALVATSAPTSLAIERADKLGLMLVAVARRDTFTVFTNTAHLLTASRS